MTDYELLTKQLRALAETDRACLPLFSNAAALLWEALPDVNWAGFYLLRGETLVLGPFQGRPACIHIAMGRGVCGTAAESDCVQRVADVHAFPGHIACDAASRSEIVLPLHSGEAVVAVLDLDSPLPDRFSAADEDGLRAFAAALDELTEYGDPVPAREPAPLPALKPGRYRHFKGKEYELLTVARHSESGEAMVVYRALYGEGGVWVRPASMWSEEIARDGVTQPRFTFIGEGDE